ncbi:MULTISPECIES: branched-chain amino acid ABC transporter permease [unclassified Variovorax]|uniref:branched-chain amino acid ABC transporter permease n=1 Tax=unclassified Variovorax TaxID=663243 RepID=UPI001BD651B4|nr:MULTISPECIES: branched-chain amino acid ABC transporter permease [unclassified Variovorax]
MNEYLASFVPLICLTILNCGLALSQYVVLRVGVFSVATAALAAMGAYTAGGLVLRFGASTPIAVLAGTLVATGAALVLAIPLSRLRGVFQAIATVAAVQINLSLVLYYADWTGGPLGLNGIPRSVGLAELLVFLAIVLLLLIRMGRSHAGAAFDAIRQDETVAVSLGIRVAHYHFLAFGLSGAIAGATGALMACYNHVVVPEEFGFNMLVSVLTFVVLGGSRSVLGPIVGAVILSLLPEVARPFAENRLVIHGALLMVVIIYLPLGIADSLALATRRRRTRLALTGQLDAGRANVTA